MKSKNFLVITDLFFNLPDNFNGTEEDAFQLLANYIKEQKNINIGKNDNNNLFDLIQDQSSKCYCNIKVFNKKEILEDILKQVKKIN